jgi:septum site-determining protein MinC
VIKLKGMRDSMIRCVIPEELGQAEIVPALKEAVSDGLGLLPGCKVVLDFGARPLTQEIICSMLSAFVFPSGIEVAAWLTYDARSQDILKRAGLSATEFAAFSRTGPLKSTGPGLILCRSFRSGQRVEHRGDVIIAGHVNDGAEVFASGNVTVLGRLKGLVHAGYEGDESAAVTAFSMETLQLRIGGRVGSLDRDALWWGKKVIARIEEGAVLIDYWPELKSGKSEGNA